MANSPTQADLVKQAASDGQKRTLSVAVIGAGAVSQRHAAALAEDPRVRLACVCDPREEAGSPLAAKHGVPWVSEAQTVLADNEVDAVYLCVPHHLHHEMALQALAAGKHVFIEKPMANTVEQCDAIIQAAQQAGCAVVVGHQYRFLPLCTKLKELIQSGAVGQVVAVVDRIVFDYRVEQRPKWFLRTETAGGGVMMNTTVHQIDRVCWLLDALPQAVDASIGRHFAGYDIDSHVSALWRMPENRSVHLVCMAYPSRPENSVEVIGTTGQIRIDFVTRTLTLARGGEPELELELHDPTLAAGRMVDQLVAAAFDGQTPQTDAAWGRQVVRLAMVHYESAQRGQPVEIS